MNTGIAQYGLKMRLLGEAREQMIHLDYRDDGFEAAHADVERLQREIDSLENAYVEAGFMAVEETLKFRREKTGDRI